jgi:UDP-2,3-diacylglucosamine hydrolase
LIKAYFTSDFHLGDSSKIVSRQREALIVEWMDKISQDATHLFLVGDVFDFWFDYKKVVPKGYIRILGKIAELKDKGIDVRFFTGNHDLWMKDYLWTELSIPIYQKPILENLGSKKFFIGHGDGLGPGDYGYKRLKKLFKNPLAQWLFRWIHPDIGISLANYFSGKSREAQAPVQKYLGPDKEWLIQYVHKKHPTIQADYYIFGHRHLPIDYNIYGTQSRYVNLGDWLNFQSYAEFDGSSLKLKFYKNDKGVVYS